MHFSIPETVEQRDAKGSSFTSYVIHINGVRHCSVRYRQLHTLHDHLRREIRTSAPLPAFPAKKLLPLSHLQIEDRRAALEKYLQIAAQDARVQNSLVFNGFLLAAQQETRGETAAAAVDGKDDDVEIDVFLMNEQKVVVRGAAVSQTEEILEKVCAQLGLPEDIVYYFALFLVQRRENGDFVIARKLQDFESPYISQKTSANRRLVLRKASWHSKLDEVLFKNRAALNLLYLQTAAEIERGWIEATDEEKNLLSGMQAKGAKLDYMEKAYKLPLYGYVHFLPCICDYPMSNTPAQIIIGDRELLMKVRTSRGEMKAGSFKVTRMRCWRIMALDGKTKELDVKSAVEEDGEGTKLELSFEYLMNNQDLQWITIVSSQAILMSLCLQSIVEELLRVKSGLPIKKAGEASCASEYVFEKKDGSNMSVSIRRGLHAAKAAAKHNQPLTSPKIDPKVLKSLSERQYSVKKLSEKFDKVNFRAASQAAEDVLIENEAFGDIADEGDVVSEDRQ